MADVPVAIYRPDAAGIGTNEYLVGGGNPFVAGKATKATKARKGPKMLHPSTRSPAISYNTTYIYDTTSDSWSSGPNTNVAHSFTGGTAIGTKLIVVTGFDGVTGDTNTVELADAGGGGGACTDYTFALDTATFVPGVDDIGSHCDDCDTPITLPFSVTLYDQTFTTANAGSNGHLTFGVDAAGFGITCSPFGIAGTTYVDAPYWGDQCTGACGAITCDTCGIFTTTTGTAPNRVFYIEWRTQYYNQPDTLNYEVALYENSTPPFQFIYSTINPASAANDSELAVGVKKDDANFNQYGCDPSGGQAPPVSSGQALRATCIGGGTPTPTPTCTPGGNQWSEVAALPFAARGPFCVSDGTFYYIGGGYDGTNVHSDLLRYDPVANTYTPLASAPDQFFLSQAVIFNNKIYSIAGFNLGGQSNTTRIYDIASDS